jgi:hypothetical protein
VRKEGEESEAGFGARGRDQIGRAVDELDPHLDGVQLLLLHERRDHPVDASDELVERPCHARRPDVGRRHG